MVSNLATRKAQHVLAPEPPRNWRSPMSKHTQSGSANVCKGTTVADQLETMFNGHRPNTAPMDTVWSGDPAMQLAALFLEAKMQAGCIRPAKVTGDGSIEFQ